MGARLFVWVLCCFCAFAPNALWAHASHELHREDYYAVLPFQEDSRLDAWMRLLGSQLIDKYNAPKLPQYGDLGFYDYLKHEFPPFACKHRVLFHWGFNARPWNSELEKKMVQYKWSPEKVKKFQSALIAEQKRRNGLANAKTEKVFGLASGGKEAGYANAMVSFIYDVHLLGDWTPDNKDFTGVAELGSVVGDLINALRRLDAEASKSLIKDLQKESKRNDLPPQLKAQNLLDILKSQLPQVIKEAQGGALWKRWQKMGYKAR